jgi:hypothetical protein
MLLNTTILYPNHAKIAPINFIIQFLSNLNNKNAKQNMPFCQKTLIVISRSPLSILHQKSLHRLFYLFSPLFKFHYSYLIIHY